MKDDPKTVSGNAIAANIENVRLTGGAFNALVHETIIGILIHAEKYGDCNGALALVKAMPKSTKRDAVVSSFRDYSPIRMNVPNDAVGFLKADAKGYKPFNLDGYRADPWYDRKDMQKDQLDATLESTIKAIFGLASRLQKSIDEGHVSANDKDAIIERVTGLKLVAGAVAKPKVAPAAAPAEALAA